MTTVPGEWGRVPGAVDPADRSKALQELLPARKLVQFAEEDRGNAPGPPIQPEYADEAPGVGEDEFPVIDVVPVDVSFSAMPAGGGLVHLARIAGERHLAVVGQMLGQPGVVDTGCRHDDNCR